MKKYFTVYDRYIFNQCLMATLVAILLFIIVWIAPETLLKVIKNVFTGVMTPKAGILILLYEVPKILAKAFPVGLLLGTLFTFDKLGKDSELTIFRATGMSFARIVRPVLVLAAIVTILCFMTFDKWIPYVCMKVQEIKGTAFSTQFIYTQKDKNNHPSEAIVVSHFKDDEMYDVIVMDFDQHIFNDLHGLEQVMVAQKGKKSITEDGEPCWKLSDINVYEIDDDGIFKSTKKIESKDILIGEASARAYTLMENTMKRDRDFTNADLKYYVRLLKEENLDEEYRSYFNKYLQRYLQPLVCILLAILGCLLGFSKPREQKLIGFTIAIGCIFIYYLTLPAFDTFAEKGILHPVIAASFPLVAFLFAIIAFYKTRDL